MSTDLEFRPASYSDFQDPIALALNGISGQMRREMVRDMLAAEGGQRERYEDVLGPIQPEILQERAEEGFIQNMTRLAGPQWLGGEYLPGLGRQEVEIARIVLDSTTMDVFSLRARYRGGRYSYRMVDEYGTSFTLCRKTSRRPLTLGQVIELLQTGYSSEFTTQEGGLVEIWWDQQREGGDDLDDCIAFAQVESEIYPELSAWYDIRASDWKKEHLDETL